MSEQRRIRRRRERTAIQAATRAARLQGCCCDFHSDVQWVDGVAHITLAHAGWCPLYRAQLDSNCGGRPPQLIVYREPLR
jgi:hypothetical protein